MSVTVEIAPRALQQLREAAEWYRERSHSDALAIAWLDGFIELLLSLQIDPERHPLARESRRFPVDVREVHYGSGRKLTHRALFQIHGRVVHVLVVRHIAMSDVTPESL